jgi:hypothetical protein
MQLAQTRTKIYITAKSAAFSQLENKKIALLLSSKTKHRLLFLRGVS